MSSPQWTGGEMLAVAASRYVQPGDLALVGLGLPQVAAVLATRTHAPDAQILLEIGVFGPCPTEPAMGIADPRMWQGASSFGGMLDALGYMLHGGRVTLGLLGALQVDPLGNINTTAVNQPDGTSRRFNGSGGGNDIASLAGRVVVVMRHERRKFARTLDFLTSPGRGSQGRDRAELGLPGLGTVAIVTDRAVIEVTGTAATLSSVHPGERVDQVLDDTPMPLALAAGDVPETSAPTAAQLALIRDQIDPGQWYTR